MVSIHRILTPHALAAGPVDGLRDTVVPLHREFAARAERERP
jgi:hypothetical protein